MSRSLKLASAAFILSYVAAKSPQLLTTEGIARAVKEHPARVRQLVAQLVKAGLLTSVRGAQGGIGLGRAPRDIDFRQVFAAVEDQPLLSISIKDPFNGWGGKCKVRPTFDRLYREMEEAMEARLASITLDQLFSK